MSEIRAPSSAYQLFQKDKFAEIKASLEVGIAHVAVCFRNSVIRHPVRAKSKRVLIDCILTRKVSSVIVENLSSVVTCRWVEYQGVVRRKGTENV